MKNNKRDYYDVLGINKSATEDEIKKAYKKMALKYHPDRNKEADAEAKFKEINEAYSVLSDKDKKEKYDRFGFSGLDDNNIPADFDDIFSSIFGMGNSFGMFNDFPFGGGMRFNNSTTKNRNRPIKGDDIFESITIGFYDSVFGCVKNINISVSTVCDKCEGKGGKNIKTCSTCKGCGISKKIMRNGNFMQQTIVECSDCHGTGEICSEKCNQCNGKCFIKKNKLFTVQIKPGVLNGSNTIFKGEGNSGLYGGRNGDIIITINVKPHKILIRKDYDVYLDLPIMFNEAILGCTKNIPTIYGNEEIEIKPLTQNNQILEINNLGFMNGKTKGKMIIKISIVIPDKIDDKDKELLKQIRTYETKDTMKIKNFII